MFSHCGVTPELDRSVSPFRIIPLLHRHGVGSRLGIWPRMTSLCVPAGSSGCLLWISASTVAKKAYNQCGTDVSANSTSACTAPCTRKRPSPYAFLIRRFRAPKQTSGAKRSRGRAIGRGRAAGLAAAKTEHNIAHPHFLHARARLASRGFEIPRKKRPMVRPCQMVPLAARGKQTAKPQNRKRVRIHF